MSWRRLGLLALWYATLVEPARAQPGPSPSIAYAGTCDASAAVALDRDLFVVASDEDNVLWVYRRGQGGGPVASFLMDEFLDLEPQHRETDIEGAARIGDRIYWITSHGRNKEGKKRPNRRRLFATEVKEVDGRIDISGIGSPYKNLLDDLNRTPALRPFDLGKAAMGAPEAKGGLNIEGLAATPQGHLLIAFRNPIPDGRALLVPLENPDEVIRGRRARLGRPITLSLGGRGVRSIEARPGGGSYLIVAGHHDNRPDFRLYRWSGNPDAAPERIKGVDFGDLKPEALFFDPEGDRASVQVLSDDGGRTIEGRDCKDLDAIRRRFRGTKVIP